MLATETVKRVLNAALRNGGDLAELYLENTEQLQLGLDDQKLENAQQGSDVGGGVRVFYGSTAAYAYTDDLSEAALIEAGATPDEAVMIGDTTFDIVMARAAGVRAIGVDWGYHSPEELLAEGAEAVATSCEHLEQLMQ